MKNWLDYLNEHNINEHHEETVLAWEDLKQLWIWQAFVWPAMEQGIFGDLKPSTLVYYDRATAGVAQSKSKAGHYRAVVDDETGSSYGMEPSQISSVFDLTKVLKMRGVFKYEMALLAALGDWCEVEGRLNWKQHVSGILLRRYIEDLHHFYITINSKLGRWFDTYEEMADYFADGIKDARIKNVVDAFGYKACYKAIELGIVQERENPREILKRMSQVLKKQIIQNTINILK